MSEKCVGECVGAGSEADKTTLEAKTYGFMDT